MWEPVFRLPKQSRLEGKRKKTPTVCKMNIKKMYGHGRVEKRFFLQYNALGILSNKEREVHILKRLVYLFACLCLVVYGYGAASAEESFQFDTSREIAAYLDEADLNYALEGTTSNYEAFVLTYTPANSEKLDKVIIRILAYENSAVIVGNAFTPSDTSDMLKLYQTLENMNDSISFVRYIYNSQNDSIYPRMEVPYVADADFGRMVERNVYITARTVDETYDELVGMLQ